MARSQASTDSLDLVALDPDGDALVLVAGLARPSRRPLTARSAALLGRVAAHIGAARRLRKRATSGRELLDGRSPIFTPQGGMTHEGDVRDELALRELRDAVKLRRGARSKRVDTSETLERWRALVERRYSIVDVFDSDGRRYVVARPNAPEARAAERTRELSHEERATLSLLATGASNKLIAYHLGVGVSTIASRLAVIAKKLGAPDGASLVRLAQSLESDASKA